MSELINNALPSATDTKAVVFKPGAIRDVADVFKEQFPGKTAIVVGDDRTMEVAGNGVQRLLVEAGVPTETPHVFPGDPELYAEYENIEALRDKLKGMDVIAIAVGSGTLNDIVKRASGELERGYIVVGTAASMDGYVAFGASIAVDGLKQTLSCPAPRAAVVDLELMSKAPQIMTASGYGDLLGKVPAGADWILADSLQVEEIDRKVWDQVQGPLRKAIARPADLATGEISAIADLSEGLIMSGLAMQAHSSSRPASGAEHQFSHLWEMEGHGVDIKPRRLSHGFKVGIGTVSIAALYELLLDYPMESLDIDKAVTAWQTREEMEANVRAAHPNPVLQDQFVELALKKWVTLEDLRTRLEKLVSVWPDLREKLRAQLLPAELLQQQLRDVGAPAHPSDIKLEWNRFRETYCRAQMIRARYTVLDVALEANLLDDFVSQLFSPNGFWGKQEG